MKLFTKISLILLIPILYGLTSCIKEVQYPIEPKIEFKSYERVIAVDGKDSLIKIAISYSDGDGDIGLDATQLDEPYKYNYFIKFNQLIDGNMVDVLPPPPNDTLTFNGRIPILTPAGKNKNIKGDITMTIDLYFAILQSNTINFEIYIKDRALNQSNIVTTPRLEITR
jgi:hypothetical protein